MANERLNYHHWKFVNNSGADDQIIFVLKRGAVKLFGPEFGQIKKSINGCCLNCLKKEISYRTMLKVYKSTHIDLFGN